MTRNKEIQRREENSPATQQGQEVERWGLRWEPCRGDVYLASPASAHGPDLVLHQQPCAHTHTHRMKVLSIYKNKFVIIITDLKAHLYPSFILLRNHSIFSINWNVENDVSHCTKERENGKAPLARCSHLECHYTLTHTLTWSGGNCLNTTYIQIMIVLNIKGRSVNPPRTQGFCNQSTNIREL